MKHNSVVWFEIPVLDLDRAVDFYQKVFKIEMSRMDMGGTMMAFFPWVDNAVGSPGALVQHPDKCRPSAEGPLIYFGSNIDDLSDELSRVEPSGGKIVMPRTIITEEIGYMAIFIDTEGNRVALHSMK